MYKSSCISHPSNNPAFKIYDWQLKATGGNHCAASLLSSFESMINNDNGMIDYQEKFNGTRSSLIRDVGIPLKLAALRKILFGFWAEKKISEALELLQKLEFIKINSNPDPEEFFDRTKFIRFYPETCNEWIRKNYSVDGEFIAKSNDPSPETAKREIRDGEKAFSITPKGSLETAKKETRKCQKADSCDQTHDEVENSTQVIDLFENAKKETREGEKADSITPKGVSYINNINSIQSINSININQVENEKLNKSQSLETEQIAAREEPNVETIIGALIEQGLPSEKFNYPDALPAIAKLAEQGATVEMFIKAYVISSQATAGKGFGVNYLVKVVESLLVKLQRTERKTSMVYEPKFKTIKPKPVSERVYTNNFRNAMSWAGDIIGDWKE